MRIPVRALCGCLILAAASASVLAAGKKLTVRVIDRVDNDSTYTYVVPGYSRTTTTENANCVAGATTTNCNGSSTSSTTRMPAQSGSYDVEGTTLSLQLPDGRVAVVNCDSKLNYGFGAPRRSCRIPTVSTLEAEFNGDKVKLHWQLGIDGEKDVSETYKLVAVLDKR